MTNCFDQLHPRRDQSAFRNISHNVSTVIRDWTCAELGSKVKVNEKTANNSPLFYGSRRCNDTRSNIMSVDRSKLYLLWL